VGGDIQLAGPFNDIDITGIWQVNETRIWVIPLDGATTVNTEVEAIPFWTVTAKLSMIYQQIWLTPCSKKNKPERREWRLTWPLRLLPSEIIFDRTNNDKLVTRGNGRLTLDYDTRGGFR
jgi:hypothetical protein